MPTLYAFVIGAMLLAVALNNCRAFAQPAQAHPPSSLPLWEETVGKLKNMQLGDSLNAYDSAHFLMVPMHRAFETGDVAGQEFFTNLVAGLSETSYQGLNLLTKMQLDYFVSEYLVLKHLSGSFDDAEKALLKRQIDYFEQYWTREPFKQWEKTPYKGVRDRLIRILSRTIAEPGKSYLGAATDFELFGLAIAANLELASRSDTSLTAGNFLMLVAEASQLASQVVNTRGEFIGTGWLFQRGYWRDHSDFLYAGHQELAPNLAPLPVEGIAQDSSHSIRWALWIRSFFRSARSAQDKELYSRVATALSVQYREKIIRKLDSGLTMSNYMDGNNGIYRYKYGTVGDNAQLGYAPGALSGSLFIGWLCFLPDMPPTMSAMADSFPLPPDMVALYTGPNTTRKRNPLFAQPAFYTNGIAELIAQLSVGCAGYSDQFWHQH